MTPAEKHKFEAHLAAPNADVLLRADLAKSGWLDALLPELRAEMDFPQVTRYHAYSIFEHSLRTMMGMPANPQERLLGLLHDIGKHRCVSIKKRDDGVRQEQFLGHGEAGAKMIVPILARIGYDREFIETMARQVYLHMDLHLAANNGLSAKAQAKLLGKIEPDLEILKRLQIADINAMNPVLAPAMRKTALGYHRILAETIAAREADRTTDCDPIRRRRPQLQAPAKPLPNFTARADRPRSEDDEPDTKIGVAQTKESPDDLIRRYRRMVTQRSDRPVLVLVNGLPGSGKTYLAEKFVHELGFIRVSSDDIRMALTGGFPNYHSFPEVLATHGTVRKIAAALLADGARVVADSTSRIYSERKPTIAVGREAGVPVVVVWCKVDDATAAERMFNRATNRDEADRSEANVEIRAGMAHNATPPSANEADLVIFWTPPIESQVWDKLRSFVEASSRA